MREPLLRELLGLEIYHRTQRGDRPTPDEYVRRFPGHEALIRSLLGGPGQPASEDMASTQAYVPGEVDGAGPHAITARRERKPAPRPGRGDLIGDSVSELRERLREAEKQRASEQRKRRRAQWLVVGTVLAALTAAVGGGVWIVVERAAWQADRAAQAAQLQKLVAAAQQQAEAARQEADAARQQAAVVRQQAEAARLQADAARQQADTAQKQVRDLIGRLRLAGAKTSYDLGGTLSGQKNPRGAVTAYQKAIQLNPTHAEAHYGLGNALRDSGDQSGAIAAFQKAIQLKPNYGEAHNNLGLLLYARKDLEGAQAAYDKAIQSKPTLPHPHYNLGTVLLDLGRFGDAEATTRRTLELLPPQQPLHQLALRQVERCERLQALDKKLAAILKEEAKPADAAERVGLAELCQLPYQQRYATAARLYSEAFAEKPDLAADRKARHRYKAASTAIRAGVGQGRDRDAHTEAQRAERGNKHWPGCRPTLRNSARTWKPKDRRRPWPAGRWPSGRETPISRQCASPNR